VIGTGLIGGSLAMALRKAGWRVTASDRDRGALRQAIRRGAASRACADPREAVRGASVVVLAVPVQAMVGVMRRIAPALSPATTVTDACSVKGPVVDAAARILPWPRMFVGAHPMSGRETSGIGAALPGLFRGRACIVTPVKGTSPLALARARRLWRAAGCRIVRLSPARHDRIVAAVSHLPHAIAAALVRTGLRDPAASRVFSGSFRDMTRIAASPPGLWDGIMHANGRELARAARAFSRELALQVREAGRPGPRLRRMLARSAAARKRLGVPGR